MWYLAAKAKIIASQHFANHAESNFHYIAFMLQIASLLRWKTLMHLH